MKKIVIGVAAITALMGTHAMAADMATKAPPAPPAPVFSWTGYYIGGNIGYAWGDDPTSTSGTTAIGGFALTPGSTTIHPDGGFSGIQSGYNWQIDPSWLVGFETDFQYGRIRGTANCLVTCNVALPPFFFTNYSTFSVTDRINWFGTVRGRVGYVAGPALLYFTGGLAYGQVEREANLVGNNTLLFDTFTGGYDNNSTKVGWTIGGGIEAKLSTWLPGWFGSWTGWSAKAEYLYIDLGHVSDTFNETYITFPFPGATRTVTSDIRENIFRVGLNYQFSGSPWH